MWKLGIWAAVAAALVAAVVVTYSHYSDLVATNAAQAGRIATLESDVAREQARVAAYKDTLTKWDAAATAQVKALEELSAAKREAGAYQKVLADVLSKHDLGALAKRKPGLIENRVNAGADRVNRLLESATGAASGTSGVARPASGRTP